MKSFYFFSFMILFAITANCQETKQPLFAMLSSIKINSEYLLKKTFTQQELEIPTMSDEPKGNKEKEKKRLQNFKDNQACIGAYMVLKINVDKLITQLKADLTISNRKRIIKQLNEGTTEDESWYKKNLDEIQKNMYSYIIALKRKV